MASPGIPLRTSAARRARTEQATTGLSFVHVLVVMTVVCPRVSDRLYSGVAVSANVRDTSAGHKQNLALEIVEDHG